MRTIRRILHEERGAVATEYGLMLTLIAIAAVVAMTAFGVALIALFQRGAEPLF